MAIINRVARLFAADAHAVIDKLEEPEVLLKQAQRDMQAAIRAGEDRAQDLEKQIEQARQAEGKTDAQLAEIGEELDVCFKAGDEDLARTVVRRRLQLEHFQEEVDKRRQLAETELDELESALRDQRLALDELAQKAEVVQMATYGAPDATSVTADEVEVAFLREKRRREAS